jgi:ABC-type transport system substrate-binding protein
VRIARVLVVVPLLGIALLLQSFFWVPSYEHQTRGNPQRLTKFIEATIGDASLPNPILSADQSSSEIVSYVFDPLLDLDEHLALRPKLAERFEVREQAVLLANPAWRLPGGEPATAAALAGRIQAALDAGSLADLREAVQGLRVRAAELRRERVPAAPEPGAADGAPAELEVALRVPEAVELDLARVVPDLLERLVPVLGAGYADAFPHARHVDLPAGEAGEALRGRLAELLPVLRHRPIILFELRRGVRFHDGHELDANDVRFTWQAIMDPRNLSPRTSDFEPIEAVEVLDPHRLRVVYRRLFSPAVYAWAYMGILPEHLLDAAALGREMDERGVSGADRDAFGIRHSRFNRHPVGTGAFRFDYWRSDDVIHLLRNPEYFEGAPEYHEVFIRVIPDVLTQELEFRAGAVDLYATLPHQVARYREDPAYQAFSSVGFGYSYIGYNLRRPPFDDVRVRRALGMAIDGDAILEYVLYGEGERVTGPYAITTEWYDRSVAPLPYDPEGAQRLLAEAGWRPNAEGLLEKDGQVLAFNLITNNGNPQRKAIATIAQDSWRRLGIRCETQLFEWAVFLKDFVNPGHFDAVVLGWSTGVDPDQYQVWHSSQTQRERLNFVGYRSPEADALIEALRLEYDRERQRELAHRLHRRIAEDQPYTFLFASRSTTVVDRKIVMVERDAAGGERFVKLRPSPTGQLTYWFNRWKKLDHVPEW